MITPKEVSFYLTPFLTNNIRCHPFTASQFWERWGVTEISIVYYELYTIQITIYGGNHKISLWNYMFSTDFIYNLLKSFLKLTLVSFFFCQFEHNPNKI